MTTLSHFLTFAIGLIVGLAIHYWIFCQHRNSWRSEYRRLMAGIDGALIALRNTNTPRVSRAIRVLTDTYNGISWPRK
jgi:hypothetical protein